ncbi:MAG TPA: hypothetical protein VFD31_09765 [Thermoleophilaceae bacterium]|nr:hypothetical protein [Thermoleophilaceae bacterium]
MSAQPAAGHRGRVASALAVASEWLVEPAEAAAEARRALLQDRVAVAVVGLGPRSGATTVARALGTELAVRDADGACAVTAAAGSVLPLGTPAAGRLARALAGVGNARACGRLCLIDAPNRVALAGVALSMAPLVFDVADPGEAAPVAALAHRVVLVGGPRVEPALASAMAASLTRVGPAPLVVASRPPEGSGWDGRADIEVPHSRLGAQWALAGREARGELGEAVVALADLLERWE